MIYDFQISSQFSFKSIRLYLLKRQDRWTFAYRNLLDLNKCIFYYPSKEICSWLMNDLFQKKHRCYFIFVYIEQTSHFFLLILLSSFRHSLSSMSAITILSQSSIRASRSVKSMYYFSFYQIV